MRARLIPVTDVGPPKLKGPVLAIDVPLNDADRSEMEIWLEALDQGLFNNENLFVDTSSCLNFYKDAPKAQKELMVWRIKKWGIERVFFASDYLKFAPDATPAEALDIIRSYPFTRTELSTILNNDASTWLTG